MKRKTLNPGLNVTGATTRLGQLGVLCAALFSCSYASATLITAVEDLDNPAVIDFSQFSGCSVNSPGCTASDLPDVGGLVGEVVQFSGTPWSSFLFNGGFGLAANGSWGNGRNGYAANNSATSEMLFTFLDGPISGVGGFLNYAPGYGDPILEVLDADLNVLESYDISLLAQISTSGATSDGAFRGILRGSNDIFAIRWSGSYSLLDDLAFSRSVSAVPEPATLALFGLGLAGFGFARRKKHHRQQ